MALQPLSPNAEVPVGEKKVINLGSKTLSDEEEERLRGQIQAARKGTPLDAVKGNTPLGRIEKPKMPLLSQGNSKVPLSHDIGAAGVTPRPPGSPAVRPETVEQLKAMEQAQAQIAEEGKAQLDEAAVKKAAEEEQEKLFESFDFGAQGEAERILNNKKRRAAIEGRCADMSLADLIMRDEVKQLVPIVPKEFEVLYRSATPEESLFVKAIIAKENSPSDSYSLEKYSLCMLACSLISINGKELPEHRKSDGTGPDAALFEAKLKRVTKMSAYVVADLGINYSWFDMRVRRLLNPERLGNG
jgi:hypothetical protein